MTEREHLLVCLNEEAVEIAKDTSKALRIGLTNVEKVRAELNDLLGVARMLVQAGVLPDDWQDTEAQCQKIEKVNNFMRYARTKGALNP